MKTLITALAAVGLVALLIAGASCKSTATAQAAPAEKMAAAIGEDGIIFDFENDADLKAWKVEDEIKDKVELSASDANATSGKKSMKMVLKPHEWPGAYTEDIPADWSGCSQLQFDVFADQGADMQVRIDDDKSTDYASRFQSGGQYVNKGKGTVTIWLTDVGAKIDLKKIKRLVIFVAPVDKEMTFYIDNIRLVAKK